MTVQTYARVADGSVVEIWPSDLSAPMPDPQPTPVQAFGDDFGGQFIPCGPEVQQGWAYKGKKFSAPAAPEPEPTPTPTVSSAQAKIQLLRTPGSADGKTLLDDVTDAVKAAGGEVAIWFAEARTWEPANPYVASLSKKLKLTPEQVNQLFVEAAQIAA